MSKVIIRKRDSSDTGDTVVSSEKERLQALFDAYKKINPVKAEAKKAEFEKKLASAR